MSRVKTERLWYRWQGGGVGAGTDQCSEARDDKSALAWLLFKRSPFSLAYLPVLAREPRTPPGGVELGVVNSVAYPFSRSLGTQRYTLTF